MANISLLVPIILKWEGGYVNNPSDPGGCTNMGITLATWKQLGHDKNGNGIINCEDIKLLDSSDFELILRTYWNHWQADSIVNQSVANILVDWYWNSGEGGIKIPQRILGVEQDGVVGPNTISVLNNQDPQTIFNKIFQARTEYLNNLVISKPALKQFLHGWLNRLNSFTFSK